MGLLVREPVVGWKCGLEQQRAAQEKVHVALALDGPARDHGGIRQGRVGGCSQVLALTGVAETATEADLLMIARHATAAQLERLVRSYRGVLRRAGETSAANLRRDRRYLRYRLDDDGSLVGSFRLDPEEGAVSIKSLEAEVERSAEGDHPDEGVRVACTAEPADSPDRAGSARWVALAERALDGEANTTALRSEPSQEVVLHVDRAGPRGRRRRPIPGLQPTARRWPLRPSGGSRATPAW